MDNSDKSKKNAVPNPKFRTRSKEVDPSKTAANIENLTEDGTVKLKTYADGKKIKIYTSSDGQVIKTDTYAADGDKRNKMSLRDIIKNMRDHNIVAQRDADEREAARKEQKEEIKHQNEKMNPIKDEMGNVRNPEKQGGEKINKEKGDTNMSRETDKDLEELNRYLQRDSDLKRSRDMRDIGDSLEELGKLRKGKQDEKSLDEQIEITSKLLKNCSSSVRKSERQVKGGENAKKMPEKELAAEKKKIEVLKHIIGWISKDTEKENVDKKIEDAGLDKEKGRELKGKFRDLERDAKKAERDFPKKSGKERTNLQDIMKDFKNQKLKAEGKKRETPKAPEKEQNTFKTAKPSPQAREQAKESKGVQIGGHREKDNSFKAEIDRSKERKTNLKLGAHREAAKTDSLEKKNVVRRGREM